MIEKARRNALLLALPNAEFVQAGIESLPLPDGSVDVVISSRERPGACHEGTGHGRTLSGGAGEGVRHGIQTDRGQKVIDTGPYAAVRHPGYVAAVLLSVGSALCLGSVWALTPAGLSCLVLILRARWEDQTLRAELPGYQEYTQRVQYKLIPGVW